MEMICGVHKNKKTSTSRQSSLILCMDIIFDVDELHFNIWRAQCPMGLMLDYPFPGEWRNVRVIDYQGKTVLMMGAVGGNQ